MNYDIFDKNWVEIVRGNSATISFSLGSLVLDTDDYVLFTVKSKRGVKVIQKILTSENLDHEENSVIVSIGANETKDLITGEYYYDLLYVGANGRIKTFVSCIFKIIPNVGLYTDVEPPVPPVPPSELPDGTLITRDGHYIKFRDGKILVMKKESE